MNRDFSGQGDDWLVPGMMFMRCSLWYRLRVVCANLPEAATLSSVCCVDSKWMPEPESWTANRWVFADGIVTRPHLRWLGPGLSGVELSPKKRGSVHQFKIWKGPKLRPASCRSSCSLLLCHLRPLAVTFSERLEISDTVNMPGWSFPS